MILGFSGTRKGMTDYQKQTFREFVKKLQPSKFHHGDCIGSDEEAHYIVTEENQQTLICIHPGEVSPKLRAFCGVFNPHFPQTTNGISILPPRATLDRNRDIARACDILIITPKESEEVLHSGTWTTYRYAKLLNKQVEVIKPF